MNQHVRTVHTHSFERNFGCEHCGKEFKYRSELVVHLTHHTGELNFSCSCCAKKFRRSAEARLCEKGHGGFFNFNCSICDYKTHKKNHFHRHQKSHIKIHPFICPICAFKSSRKDNLKQHVEKRHCSGSTSIGQLEELYPDMYRSQEVGTRGRQEAKEALVQEVQEVTLELEEKKERRNYSVEEILLDQRSVERLHAERGEGEVSVYLAI